MKAKTFSQRIAEADCYWSVMTNGVRYQFLNEESARQWQKDMKLLYGASSSLVGPVEIIAQKRT